MELIINNLSKTYPNGVKALNNLNLTIGKGMFGLLGPNGAGKSSLMRTIATLQEPDQGSIHFNDIDVLKEKEKVKRNLGYLPQSFGVYPGISAQELLLHFAVLKGIKGVKPRKETVANLLHQVNLYKDRKKSVHTFSGGMKQRFGIALSLLGDPDLIIVDEPTAGLDPAERNRFNNLLSDISEDKIVILSTHIVDDVKDLCNNLAIINHGNKLINGRPSELMKELDGKVWQKRISKSEIEQYHSNYHIITSRLNEGNMLINILDDDHPGNGFSPVYPSLEDVYFSVINHSA
ncbi:ABC-type multidrug transport system, ATPase component [Zhouia amylolytica]|uniref:ABC-type multidrug transport system, ATPase component n=1 Tax=Zhouia amylolytica TaxID=376730 RepID=A0A1I6VL60_9FLAO|nr:ABC transporter ATP-binding protein [Zhouia amylolytica]SFT14462.1 ABC-type multidrug transport system, ATPase component [Zhouia amylolytica]